MSDVKNHQEVNLKLPLYTVLIHIPVMQDSYIFTRFTSYENAYSVKKNWVDLDDEMWAFLHMPSQKSLVTSVEK